MNSANLGYFAAIEMFGALNAREVSAMELAISAIARNEPNRWSDQCLPVHGDGLARCAREGRTAHARSGIRTLFENRTPSGSWNCSDLRSAGSKCND